MISHYGSSCFQEGGFQLSVQEVEGSSESPFVIGTLEAVASFGEGFELRGDLNAFEALDQEQRLLIGDV
jgi:hypothetical protein